MFEKLCNVIDELEIGINQLLKGEISQHLATLVEEMQRYFPELYGDEAAVVRNRFFINSAAIENVPDELQDEFLELRNDSLACGLFSE